MTAPRLVETTPVSNGGHDDRSEPAAESLDVREVATALIALRNDLGGRYGVLAQHVQDVHEVASDIRAAVSTIATEQARASSAITRLGVQLQAVERAVRDDDHRHGEIVGALARIEARESKHQTRLQSITDEVTEVKAAHGGWLAVGSFMDRHRKVASTVAFLVLLGFQIFHLLRK